jgi:hypothetical protein
VNKRFPGSIQIIYWLDPSTNSCLYPDTTDISKQQTDADAGQPIKGHLVTTGVFNAAGQHLRPKLSVQPYRP